MSENADRGQKMLFLDGHKFAFIGGTHMGRCSNHPDTETSYQCQKHAIYLCERCLACRDPENYCKFRTACPIWFFHKEQRRAQRENAAVSPSARH